MFLLRIEKKKIQGISDLGSKTIRLFFLTNWAEAKPSPDRMWLFIGCLQYPNTSADKFQWRRVSWWIPFPYWNVIVYQLLKINLRRDGLWGMWVRGRRILVSPTFTILGALCYFAVCQTVTMHHSYIAQINSRQPALWVTHVGIPKFL